MGVTGEFWLKRKSHVHVCMQTALRDLTWSIDLDEFEELLVSKRESAPVPDWLPHGVSRSAGCIGAKCLFAANQAALQGAALLEGFGASRTVLKLARSTPRAYLSVRLNL